MAYNTYFPQQYYPQYYGNQQMSQNQPQMMPNAQPQQSNGIIWVLGENAAKAYPVASGQTVILMELHERTAEQKQAVVRNSQTTEDFVSRKEFEEFREDVKRSIKGMRRHEEEGEG